MPRAMHYAMGTYMVMQAHREHFGYTQGSRRYAHEGLDLGSCWLGDTVIRCPIGRSLLLPSDATYDDLVETCKGVP